MALQVMQCDATEVATHIGAAHVAVPFMARLDDATLAHARHLKLIIQYGVGVEGIDIPSVRPHPCLLSHVCAAAPADSAYRSQLMSRLLVQPIQVDLSCDTAAQLRRTLRGKTDGEL